MGEPGECAVRDAEALREVVISKGAHRRIFLAVLTCNLSRLKARFNLPPEQVSNLVQDGDFASAEPRRPYRLARTALSP